MLLQINNLSAGYSDIEAVHDLNLKVEPGQIVALVGGNAAGKSTTLNSISGIVPQCQGTIDFLGHDLLHWPPHKIAGLGLIQVPEGRRVFPFMTVGENLDMGCFQPKLRPHRKANLERVFGLLPILQERRKQLAGSLSGGEQQMLAIGRGLMAEPALLMLDEPTLGLAPMFVDKVFALALEIRNMGASILLVEQNVHRALAIADYAYVMENGYLVMEGRGESLMNNDALVTAYLGL